MNSNEEKIRSAIADQASEWFVASDEGRLDERDSADLVKWLKTSPVHVEEFLGVSAIVRDLTPDFQAMRALTDVRGVYVTAAGDKVDVVRAELPPTTAATAAPAEQERPAS